MLLEFMAYVLLGLLIAVPLWWVIRFAVSRSGLWAPRLDHVRPYVLKDQRPISAVVLGKKG